MGGPASFIGFASAVLPLSFLLFLTVCSAASFWQHCIYVDPENGVDNKSCWHGGWLSPCAKLNLALQGAQQYNLSTVLFFQPGNYFLQNSNETHFLHISQLAMIGNSSTPEKVVIHCQSPAGLIFVSSQELTIYSLTFINCGIMVNNGITAVLYFVSCENVSMRNMAFINSCGSAAVFENTAGNVYINESSYNCTPSQYWCQGIFLLIEEVEVRVAYVLSNNVFLGNKVSAANPHNSISFCSSFDSYPNIGVGAGLRVVIKGAARGNQILIQNTTISKNSANFGGGLLIALCDSATENEVIIEGTHFTMNYASGASSSYQKSGDGGGALVVFEKVQENMNLIMFTDCAFISNSATHGGGLAIVSHAQPSVVKPCTKILSKIHVHKCTFSSSQAHHGSALYLYRICSNHGSNFSMVLSYVEIYDNVPIGNHVISTGVVYSYFSSFKLSGSVTFTGNQDTVLCLISSQTLVSNNSSVIIENNVLSYGRLVVMECSVLTVSEHTTMEFTDNSKVSVVLFSVCGSDVEESRSECFLQYTNKKLHPDKWNAKLSFAGNSGCAPNENDWNCKYDQSHSLPALVFDANILSCVWPDNDSNLLPNSSLNSTFRWKSFEYANNYYSNMIMSGPTEIVSMEQNLTFVDGMNIIFSSRLYEIYDYLGQQITDSIVVQMCIVEEGYYFHTQFNTDITCWYNGLSVYGGTQLMIYSADNDCNTDYVAQFHLEVMTVGTIVLAVRIPVTFYRESTCNILQCSHGTILTFCCQLGSHFCLTNFFTFINKLCTNSGNQTYYVERCFGMQDGYCFWTNAKRSKTIFGKCPSSNTLDEHSSDCGWAMSTDSFCTADNGNISYPCDKGREGVMCGFCQADFTVAINSLRFECIDCDEPHYGWLIFIGVQIIPLTVFLLLLMFFGVSLNYLSTNAYILFSQMVTLWFPRVSYPSWFLLNFSNEELPILGFPYSMWSLDFVLPLPINKFCLFPGMTTIEVIAFQYISAAYPLLVIALTSAWLEMYARGVRPVFYITRSLLHLLAQLSRRIKIERSLTDTFAVMYVLSFTQLARVSAQLLTFTTLTVVTTNEAHFEDAFYYDASLSYFSGEHLPYGLLAVVVLAVFVIAPTVFLLLYPFKFFQRLLSLLHLDRPGIAAVVDAFSGSFRNGSTGDGIDSRFFAGVLLIFRILFVTLYSILLGNDPSMNQIVLLMEIGVSLAMAGLILLLRPYRVNSTNVTDFFIFLLLGLGPLISIFYVFIFYVFSSFYFLIPILIVMYLPAFGLFCFLISMILKKLSKVCQRQKPVIIAINDEDGDDEQAPLLQQELNGHDNLFADHLMNPDEYGENHFAAHPALPLPGNENPLNCVN